MSLCRKTRGKNLIGAMLPLLQSGKRYLMTQINRRWKKLPLAYIHANFSFLSQSVKMLKSTTNFLSEALKEMKTFRTKWAKLTAQKLVRWSRRSAHISIRVKGSKSCASVHADWRRDTCLILKIRNARMLVTSCVTNMQKGVMWCRTYISPYKSLFHDKRHRFTI